MCYTTGFCYFTARRNFVIFVGSFLRSMEILSKILQKRFKQALS